MTAPVDTTTGSRSPGPTAPPPRRPAILAAALDAVIVGVWSTVAGLTAGWVWVQVVTPPEVTRTGGSATVPTVELAKQVAIDGWFAVIALVAGALSGVLLLAWRRRDPLLMVPLVALGGGLASWLMVQVGKVLGPDEELAALRRLPDGSHVSEQLRLHATGVAWVWSIAAVFGALVYLWVLAKPGADDDTADSLR
jgi:hypothetical protein